MNIRQIKLFFCILFASDILTGCIISYLVNLLTGVITASIILILNVIVYSIILKADKAGRNGAK
ncbi:MAG: hypothetical protein LBQ13_01390 [Endomicrobium sp.]|jgi:heme O synthase-like polyprenyltransferase|nr:hypothetical protein [Endomicrobium sp.]